jgi:hypothetical protein
MFFGANVRPGIRWMTGRREAVKEKYYWGVTSYSLVEVY